MVNGIILNSTQIAAELPVYITLAAGLTVGLAEAAGAAAKEHVANPPASEYSGGV
jgi:hypothetical protein